MCPLAMVRLRIRVRVVQISRTPPMMTATHHDFWPDLIVPTIC